jgi:hypothetical protein
VSAQGLFAQAEVNRDLTLLAPRFREAVEAALAECHANGLDARVWEGYRSTALQAVYYARGRTVIPPKSTVTNARTSLFSWHGYGLAVDVVSTKDFWEPPEGEAWFRKVAEIFKRHNCNWGGDWTHPDTPHFQWHRCKPSPSDRARMLIANEGLQAVWREVGAAFDEPLDAQPVPEPAAAQPAPAAAAAPTSAPTAPAIAAPAPAPASPAPATYQRGDKGPGVVELQMRLAGFRGTVPDGDFGAGTELQVTCFQRDFMQMDLPHGRADADTMAAIDRFAAAYPVDFAQLRCRCGTCSGFGRGLHKGQYSYSSHVEAYNMYEYPGIHRMLLWSYRAAMHYAKAKGWQLRVNSGYRCSEDNRIHHRSSTNHRGKAVDMDIVSGAGTDEQRCNALRGIMVERASAQIGWSAANRKALEPANIAPTWVHMDVRCYAPQYLDDRYFVRDAQGLDRAPV